MIERPTLYTSNLVVLNFSRSCPFISATMSSAHFNDGGMIRFFAGNKQGHAR